MNGCLRVGSLFTGIGGFDLGLERAGHAVEWQCERDAWRRSVLSHHWPGLATVFDVRDVGPDTVRPVDLLCGGFPCQDLSVAGQRAGLQGSRSSLFFEFARAADGLVGEGGWVLVENVPGLFSSNGGRDFAIVLATLADIGFYDLAWRVLDSRYFGVPQRRRRVFILARRASGRCAAEVLLEPESRARHTTASDQAGQGVAVASLSGLGSGGADDNDGQAGRIVTVPVSRALNTHWNRQDGTVDTYVFDPLTRGGGGGRRQEDDYNIVPIYALGSHAGSNGDASNASHAAGGPVGMGIREGETPALRSGRTQAIAGAGVRRLTPVECERLQGFPDGWTDHGPDTQRYAALGDAVTVPVAAWIGDRLSNHVRG